ncbi:Ku protein [Streptomyces massasporeus]|uniref:Ku protein n=1 Tax=Streptomyces massasporeus TaxID=67324 RepID=UPI0037FE42B8
MNERTGDEVDTSDIVKGYEVSEGEYVTVEPEELDEIAPGRSKTIDITDSVDLEEIDPVHFARTHHLAPTARSTSRSTSCCERHWPSRTESAWQRS